tara:strand:- start:282 stop:614 length:333 start_codon:yes stop_codon:yes gene_type:complete
MVVLPHHQHKMVTQVVPVVVVDMVRVVDLQQEIHILAHLEQHLLMDGVMMVEALVAAAAHIMDQVAVAVPVKQDLLVVQPMVDMVVMVYKFLQLSETLLLNQTPLVKVVV